MSRGLHEFIKGTTHNCQPSRGFMHSQIRSFVALCRSDCSSTALNELFCSITAFVCFVPSDRAQVGHQSSPWTERWTAGGLVKVVSLNASNWTCHHFTITYMTSIHFFFSRSTRSTRNHNFIPYHILGFLKILSELREKQSKQNLFLHPALHR